jgi:hypothetical protein
MKGIIKMRKWQKKGLTALLVAIVVLAVPLTGMAAETTTIEGEVNDNYQIVASDGQIYEVAENSEGNTLVLDHIAERVRVTGTIAQEGDDKIITVASFQILED